MDKNAPVINPNAKAKIVRGTKKDSPVPYPCKPMYQVD
jgi:hypothetical protein